MNADDQTPQSAQTPLTPPTAPAPASADPTTSRTTDQAAPPADRRAGARAITIVTAVIGGVALLASGGAAAAAATGDLTRTDRVQSIDVTGIDGIELDVSASDVRVRFGDVSEAELSVTNGRGPAWTLERDDDDLIVRSPSSPFGWWFGGWFGADERVVLTLPMELRDKGLDGSFSLSAGSLDLEGQYDELSVDLSAGDLTIDGSAVSLDVEVNAGGADILLDGVTDAEFGVSAGDVAVELTGTAPRETSIDVSAGSLDLTMPDAEYNISQDVSAGTLENGLPHSTQAKRSIDVTLSAGTVTLKAAR